MRGTCGNMRQFALQLFVYVNPPAAAPDAASAIQKILSEDDHLCEFLVGKVKEVGSLGRLRIDLSFQAENPSDADEKAENIIQALMARVNSATEKVREGSNLLSYA